MEQYVYLIRPLRANFIDSMTTNESDVMGQHFQYLQDLLKEEKVILAGPCLDGAFGIVIFQAESLEHAQKVMQNDPAVKEGVMKAELHPYRVSLSR